MNLVRKQDAIDGTQVADEVSTSSELRKTILTTLSEVDSEFYRLALPAIYDYKQFRQFMQDENLLKDPNNFINLKKLLDEMKNNWKTSLVRAIHFEYLDDISRFNIQILSDQIRHIRLSDQINYILGYEAGQKIKNGTIAKYACDLRGGVSHIYCYADGIIDDVIVGDSLSPLLEVIAVTGKPGQIIQEKFDSPMYGRVVVRELNEVGIELRTIDGRLVPFEYGTVVVKLIFKKVIVF